MYDVETIVEVVKSLLLAQQFAAKATGEVKKMALGDISWLRFESMYLEGSIGSYAFRS